MQQLSAIGSNAAAAGQQTCSDCGTGSLRTAGDSV